MLMNAKNLIFQGHANERKAIENSIFGRELEDYEYAQIAGVCVPNVIVTVVYKNIAYPDHPIQIKAKSEQADQFSVMLLLQKDAMVMESIALAEGQRGAGTGREVFYHIAKKAAELGFQTIKGTALRKHAADPNTQYSGYKAVVRWGFNGQVPDQVRAALPEKFKGVKDLQTLGQTKEGRDAWSEHGANASVEFDLSPESKGWDILGTPPNAAGNDEAKK